MSAWFTICAVLAGFIGLTDSQVACLDACASGSVSLLQIVKKAPHKAEPLDTLPARLPLIPYPALVNQTEGLDAVLQLTGATRLVLGAGVPEDDLAIAQIRSLLARLPHGEGNARSPTTVAVRLVPGELAASSGLEPPETADVFQEGYGLQVSRNGLQLEAPTLSGLFYGVQTLRQLLNASTGNVPILQIKDVPRFAWRGLMLDVSRHFFTAEEVKHLLDTMAVFKFNRFHWHLTDDQGWRLPVEGFPKLTEVGAAGFGGERAYTQEEVQDVVAHARARHIEVVAEIDLPGHCAAAIAAYPELGNRDVPGWRAPAGPLLSFGINSYTLAPSNRTLAFLEAVFETVTKLFPYPFVHIGGDEVVADEWSTSSRAISFLHGEQPRDFFTRKVASILRARGRTLVGWDEIQDVEGLPKDAVVMAWQSPAAAHKAVNSGKRVINANMEALYFDHYQGDPATEPKAIGGFSPLEQVYKYDPMPAGLSTAQEAMVLGAQGALWSEYFPDFPHVEYMAHPRSLALAERLWTPNSQIASFADFRTRLVLRLQDLDEQGANYRRLDKY